MVHEQVFLNRELGRWGVQGGGVWHFCCLIFSRFIIFTFRNYSLENCVMHLKNYFFCHHNFMKKVILKLYQNEPENIP